MKLSYYLGTIIISGKRGTLCLLLTFIVVSIFASVAILRLLQYTPAGAK